MAIQILRAVDRKASNTLKVGLYGQSGVGKTACGATAYVTDPSKVIVCYTEGQAAAIVRTHNAQALTVHMRSYEEIQQTFKWLRRCFDSGKMHTLDDEGNLTESAEPFDYETVVVDSFSDVFRTVKSEVTRQSHQRALNRHISRVGSSSGFDDPEVTSQQDWGVLQDRCAAILRAFRDLPSNLVCIFQLDEREEDGATAFRPYVQGRDLKASMIGFFNAFAYAFRRKNGDGLTREAAFQTSEQYSTKSVNGLASVEPLDFRVWHQKFQAFIAEHPEGLLSNPVPKKPKKKARKGEEDTTNV